MNHKKLKHCKTCDAVIAKSAKRCPYCGARNQEFHPIRGLIAFFVTVFALIIIIAVSGSTSDDSSDMDSSTGQKGTVSIDSKKEEVETISISAEDLWNAYQENAVNADTLYKGKMLSVTGTISDITQDALTKNPCLALSTGDSFNLYPIQCFFDGSEDTVATISELRDGQEVTIVGKCQGVSIVHVQLANCTLSN